MLKIMRLAYRLGLMNTPIADGVTHSDIQLGHRSIRIYKPEGELSGAGVLWIHGGGMLMGNFKQNNELCSQYAKELNALVISVGYRLAPEHPYPAASDDCFEGWKWFLDHAAELGVDPGRIAIAGQSAGGGLAATLGQRILDHGGIQPAAQFLWYPMLDDRTAARTELDALKHVVWDNRSNRAGWSLYLGCEAGSEAVHVNAVPARREDLSGLPTTWIGIGTIDLFYEESKEYAERLIKSGTETVLDAVPGGYHGFEIFVPDSSLSKGFVQRHFEFARRVLMPASGNMA